MSERDDWNTGWRAGNEHGTSVVDSAEPVEGQRLPEEVIVDAPAPPAVDPGGEFSMQAWEDGYLTGYGYATGDDGGAPRSANPYRKLTRR